MSNSQSTTSHNNPCNMAPLKTLAALALVGVASGFAPAARSNAAFAR